MIFRSKSWINHFLNHILNNLILLMHKFIILVEYVLIAKIEIKLAQATHLIFFGVSSIY